MMRADRLLCFPGERFMGTTDSLNRVSHNSEMIIFPKNRFRNDFCWSPLNHVGKYHPPSCLPGHLSWGSGFPQNLVVIWWNAEHVSRTSGSSCHLLSHETNRRQMSQFVIDGSVGCCKGLQQLWTCFLCIFSSVKTLIFTCSLHFWSVFLRWSGCCAVGRSWVSCPEPKQCLESDLRMSWRGDVWDAEQEENGGKGGGSLNHFFLRLENGWAWSPTQQEC